MSKIRKNINIVFDAKDQILGRLASEVAVFLIGKNTENYSSNKINVNTVLIKNIKHILFTGNKLNSKIYYKHSGYVGNLKKFTLKDMMLKNPSFVFKNAVKGMLPKNKLRKRLLKLLKIL